MCWGATASLSDPGRSDLRLDAVQEPGCRRQRRNLPEKGGEGVLKAQFQLPLLQGGAERAASTQMLIETGRPRSRCEPVWFLVRTSSRPVTNHPGCVLSWSGWQCLPLFLGALVPSRGAISVTSSHPNYLPKTPPPFPSLGLQQVKCGGHERSVLSCQAQTPVWIANNVLFLPRLRPLCLDTRETDMVRCTHSQRGTPNRHL